MPSSLARAILRTLIYSDVFDYPLTLDEMGKWLIKRKAQSAKCKSTIKNLKLINKKSGFYYLKGRDRIVEIRKKREKYSEEKIKITKESISLLKFIPFIKLIGITGALAVNNAKEEDDIDLFIVTSGGFLWTTRFIATLLIEFTGMRRHPGDNNVNNKICLNMFADENHLEISRKERDLFSAHEVLQLRPIFDRDNTYQLFLSENQWIRRYLPNAVREDIRKLGYKDIRRKKLKSPNIIVSKYLNIGENFLKFIQLWYMRNRRTKEIIKEGIIRFHPQDARIWVMKKYKEKLKIYQV